MEATIVQEELPQAANDKLPQDRREGELQIVGQLGILEFITSTAKIDNLSNNYYVNLSTAWRSHTTLFLPKKDDDVPYSATERMKKAICC